MVFIPLIGAILGGTGILKVIQNRKGATIIHSSTLPDVVIPEFVSVTDFLFKSPGFVQAEQSGRAIFVDGITGKETTCTQLRNAIHNFGANMAAKGLRKGDCLAIISPNSPEYAMVFHGTASIGGIVTTVNPLYKVTEVEAQLRTSRAKFVVTTQELLPTVKEACLRLGSQIREIFLMGGTWSGFTSVDHLIKETKFQFPDVKFDPKKDIVCLPFSSGTTGYSKGVMLSHYNLIANICQSEKFIASEDPANETFIGVLPFFHIYGMVVIMGMGLRLGVRIVTMPKFDPALFVKIMSKYKVTTAHVAPPLVSFMANHPAADPTLMPNLSEVFCGAAPLSHELADDAVRKFNLKCFRQGYGMTEMSPASHIAPYGCKMYGSIGHLLPNMQAKIVDPDTGKCVGVGKTGELLLRGPNVMLGYLDDEKSTKECLDKQGFLHTGDVGYIDEDGFWFLVDRVKELIKHKGFQIAPAELEAVILTHPKVIDCAVIGVPSAFYKEMRETDGEVPKAYVVLKPGEEVSEDDLMEYVSSLVADYKKVRIIDFVDSVPKSAAGKILRQNLRTAEEKLRRTASMGELKGCVTVG
eukprot:CAMPEP_0196586420 /NCGR_PEP_ID=MMETSP1081-20130531/54189_1 /TAXON_ID=36882 /ORGANISM="Pyramimonas amylifera, Strain CCMP720" /LENGTH=581 /DNA_ID=CAMNT_0041908293 /DNA_START=101 /DNA_END=1846 /DNA_ORIENTATION=+